MSVRGNPKDRTTICTMADPACPTKDSVCVVATGRCVKRQPSRRKYGEMHQMTHKRNKYWIRPDTDDADVVRDPNRSVLKQVSKQHTKRTAAVQSHRNDLFSELVSRVEFLASQSSNDLITQLAKSPPKEFTATALDILETPKSVFPNGRDVRHMFTSELLSTVKRQSPTKSEFKRQTTPVSVRVSKIIVPVSPMNKEVESLTDALRQITLRRDAIAESPASPEQESFEFSPVIIPQQKEVTLENVNVAIGNIFENIQDKFQVRARKIDTFKFDDEDAWEDE